MRKWKVSRCTYIYNKYVTPFSTSVRKIANTMGYQKELSRELLRQVCNWVRKNIKLLKVTRPGEQNIPLFPRDVLKERKSTCLGRAILFTSIVRAMGVNEKEIFTIISIHRKGKVPNSVHSYCIAETKSGNRNIINCRMDEEIFIVSLTRGIVYPILIERLIRTNSVPIIFNDKISLISE